MKIETTELEGQIFKELKKNPNQEYLRYTKMWKISAGLIGGLLPYTIESLLFLKSSKSFLVYLKDQRSDI